MMNALPRDRAWPQVVRCAFVAAPAKAKASVPARIACAKCQPMCCCRKSGMKVISLCRVLSPLQRPDDNGIRLTIAGVQASCDYCDGRSGGSGFGEDPFQMFASGLVSCRFKGMGGVIINRNEPALGQSRRWSPADIDAPRFQCSTMH